MADMLINAIRPDAQQPDRYVEAVRVDGFLLDISMVLNWLERPDNRAFAMQQSGDPIEVRLKRNPSSFFGPRRWLVTHPDEQLLPEIISIARC
jgi:hypothetical protein